MVEWWWLLIVGFSAALASGLIIGRCEFYRGQRTQKEVLITLIEEEIKSGTEDLNAVDLKTAEILSVGLTD